MRRLPDAELAVFLLLVAAVSASCSRHVSVNTYLARQNAGDEASIKKNYSEAEKQYKANLEDAESYGPPDQIPIALHYLADVYIAQKRYGDAEQAYRQELSSAEKIWGEGNPRTLNALTDIAFFYLDQDRPADADKYNKKALAIGEKGVSKDFEPTVEFAKSIDGMIQMTRTQTP